ncbi:MAG: hypothetical protein IPL98_14870 [Saprospiraceae bacterium]|nr:hypothetical protein [Saprospiraceae bacterium]
MFYDNLDHSILNANSVMAENYRILGFLTDEMWFYSAKSEEMVNANKGFIAHNIFFDGILLIPTLKWRRRIMNIKGKLGLTQFGTSGVIFEQKEKGIQENEVCFQNSCHVGKR